MKNYLVRLAKPQYVQDWDIWDNKTYYVQQEYTEAVICAFSRERLDQKLEKLYPGIRVISVKELK